MPQTVFIVGAGASAEVNLPLGDRLTTTVRNLLNFHWDDANRMIGGDHQVMAGIRAHVAASLARGEELNECINAARRISGGMPLAASIDNYLDAHRADRRTELCGKLAIIVSILSSEYGSPMYRDLTRPDTPFNTEAVRETWFTLFFRLLCERCTLNELHARLRTVSFIIFNYDRCIEHFLFNAVRLYYSVGDDRAAQLLNAVTFYHPYGSIGPLPWQVIGTRPAVAYGGSVSDHALLLLASGIKTFTESTEDADIEPIRAAINAATRLVFLGFAYHRQNIELLWPTTNREAQPAKRYYGTALGISDSDIDLLNYELQARTGIDRRFHGHLPQLSCAKLFHEYKQSLSLL
jgi:hypothetical protein